MSVKIDARGLSCPQPVLLVLEAIKSGTANELEVVVDNEASVENVSRAADNRGFAVDVTREDGGTIRMVLTKR